MLCISATPGVDMLVVSQEQTCVVWYICKNSSFEQEIQTHPAGKMITIATDGACSGNGTHKAKAGYGVVVHDSNGPEVSRYIWGGVEPFDYKFVNQDIPEDGVTIIPSAVLTYPSNNRGEFLGAIWALIMAIRYMKHNSAAMCDVNILTDSKLVINTLENWVDSWRARGLIYQKKNPDLVVIADVLFKLAKQTAAGLGSTITLTHVKGHQKTGGFDANMNDLADRAAVAGCDLAKRGEFATQTSGFE